MNQVNIDNGELVVLPTKIQVIHNDKTEYQFFALSVPREGDAIVIQDKKGPKFFGEIDRVGWVYDEEINLLTAIIYTYDEQEDA